VRGVQYINDAGTIPLRYHDPMELRHLRYFVAVAEELHFGRAATRLHLAQPPLSRQIRALEDEVGVALLARTNRRVALTEAGRVFLEGARRTLAQADAAVGDARRAARGEIGRLALGFVGTATYDVLPRLLRAFRVASPDVVLELRSLTTGEQVAAFRERRLDIGLLRPPVDDPTLALRTIVREPLLAVLPDTHPLAGYARVPLGALADEPFILYRRASGPATHDRIVGACLRAGFSPAIVQETDEMQTMAGLVAGGLGVALMIAPVGAPHSAGVVYRPLEGAAPTWEMALAWRRDNETAVVRAFLAVSGDVVDQLQEGQDRTVEA